MLQASGSYIKPYSTNHPTEGMNWDRIFIQADFQNFHNLGPDELTEGKLRKISFANTV